VGADTTIRPAGAGDEVRVREIVEAAFGGYVERLGLRPAPMDADYGELIRLGRAYVIGVPPAGVIVLVPLADHLLVENVAVEPDSQGKGLGRRLLGFAEEEARRLGVPQLRLYTNELMTENLALYGRLGYTETGRGSEARFRRVFFTKRLDSTLP
jgi:GNAT superfamily N-acetyltransferase